MLPVKFEIEIPDTLLPFMGHEFNYTEWRKSLFGDASVQEINSAAVEYAKNHPFNREA